VQSALTGPAVHAPSDLMALREQVRSFLTEARAGQRFRPRCDSWMVAHSPEFSRALAERGWIGMTWPREYGGSERTESERLAVNEELLTAGAPVAAHWFADRQIGPALLRNGTEDQRRRYLPAIAQGQCYFAIGMSEPDSGSDLASVRSTAHRTPSGWRLRGRKIWTSHAHHAHYILALVRTAPLQSNDRHAGLSQFIVNLEAPGIEVRPIRSLHGQAHFAEVVFDDVELADTALLGVEGAGWVQVTAELANERSGPERFLSTAPLLFELIARRAPEVDTEVGQLLAELQTLRALSAQVAGALQRGLSPALQAATVKDLGTRFESKVVEVARRLVSTSPDLQSSEQLSRLLAEAILQAPDRTIRGGTNEILRGIIARSLRS
jgi:alkylation response protein AidB-like acyl-CoA dehydrogenase